MSWALSFAEYRNEQSIKYYGYYLDSQFRDADIGESLHREVKNKDSSAVRTNASVVASSSCRISGT